MKAIDLIAGVLKAYDLGMKPFCDLCIYPADYYSFEDWQLETLATAVATITTLTAQEALDALKSVLHEVEESEGALDKTSDEERSKKEDAQLLCTVADLAKLKTVRDILRSINVETWTDSEAYVRKLDKIDTRTPVGQLIAEAVHIIGKLKGGPQ